MLSRKLLWLIALVGLLLLFVLTNNVGALCAFVAALLAPAISSVLSLWQARTLQATIELPGEGAVDASMTGVLHLQVKCPIPASAIHANIVRRNAFVGTEDRTPIVFSAAREPSQLPFEITSDCCGKLTVAVEEIRLYDVFGIMKFGIPDTEPALLHVMPQTIDLQVAIGANVDNAFDSDRYSMELSGGDPSETFALREYVPGDALRSIHWKLSEKTGQLIVRELGLPILNDVLLLFENSVAESQVTIGTHKAHAMASAFLSISRALVLMDIGHTVCWTDHGGDTVFLHEIHDQQDHETACSFFLDARIAQCGFATPTYLVQSLGSCPFAHVVNITAYMQPDIAALHCGNIVTTIGFMPDNENSGGESIIATSERTYREDLSYLEI